MPYADPFQRAAWLRDRASRRYEERRARAIETLGGVCAQCGSKKRLEFDHIDPHSKEANLHQLFSGGAQAKLDAELRKCQLLCIDCHIEKSKRDNVRHRGRRPWRSNRRRR